MVDDRQIKVRYAQNAKDSQIVQIFRRNGGRKHGSKALN